MIHIKLGVQSNKVGNQFNQLIVGVRRARIPIRDSETYRHQGESVPTLPIASPIRAVISSRRTASFEVTHDGDG